MHCKKLLNLAALSIGILASTHFLASAKHLYWNIWWLDILMHFWGGFCAALIIYWFCFCSGYIRFNPISSKFRLFLAVVLSIFIVGVAWEVYEWVFGVAGNAFRGYWLDTVSDVLCDMAGSLLGYLILSRFFWNK